MKVVTAKILDATHLELSQQIAAQPGKLIQISIPDEKEEGKLWQELTRKHFQKAYAAGDAIYDKL